MGEMTCKEKIAMSMEALKGLAGRATVFIDKNGRSYEILEVFSNSMTVDQPFKGPMDIKFESIDYILNMDPDELAGFYALKKI